MYIMTRLKFHQLETWSFWVIFSPIIQPLVAKQIWNDDPQFITSQLLVISQGGCLRGTMEAWQGSRNLKIWLMNWNLFASSQIDTNMYINIHIFMIFMAVATTGETLKWKFTKVPLWRTGGRMSGLWSWNPCCNQQSPVQDSVMVTISGVSCSRNGKSTMARFFCEGRTCIFIALWIHHSVEKEWKSGHGSISVDPPSARFDDQSK